MEKMRKAAAITTRRIDEMARYYFLSAVPPVITKRDEIIDSIVADEPEDDNFAGTARED